MQFFGRISYSLYLVHMLFVIWPENDMVYQLVNDRGWNFKLSVGLAWLVFTPIIVLVSYVLTIYVDDNFKDFAYELDLVWRNKKPPAKISAGKIDNEEVQEQSKPDD